MIKREFMAAWRKTRKSHLESIYIEPCASLSAAMADLDEAGEKLWRKYRGIWKNTTVSKVFKESNEQA